MFTTQKTSIYVTIPRHGIDDIDLSLEAKGLYCLLFSLASFSGDVEDISKLSNSTLENTNNALQELKQAGYVKIKKNEDIHLNMKSDSKVKASYLNDILPFDSGIIKTPSAEKKKKLSKFDKLKNIIYEYTEDEDLRDKLFEYYKLRLNPPKNSRFDLTGRHLIIAFIPNELKKLDSCSGDKIKVIQQSIDNEWYTFVDLVFDDKASSKSYTQEEINRMKANSKGVF